MKKILLSKIDEENWRYTLYESPNGKWYGDFTYSPQSFVDLSMLIELTNEETKSASDNRDFLIELSESIRNNYKDYLTRSLIREDFEFDRVVKRKLLTDITEEFLLKYEKTQNEKLSTQPEWKLDSIIREISSSKNLEAEKLQFDEKIEWLIENDKNPFIGYAKKLLASLITNDKMNSTISAMTNGKFLDSIGIYSNHDPITEIISDYVDKISGIRI